MPSATTASHVTSVNEVRVRGGAPCAGAPDAEKEAEYRRLEELWRRYSLLEPGAEEAALLLEQMVISLQERPEFYSEHKVSHLLFLFSPSRCGVEF